MRVPQEYSKSRPPQVGDRVGQYQGEDLVEIYTVKDIFFDGSLIKVEVWPGGGSESFIGANEEGLKVFTRTKE